ncbi:MAG: tRNA threonylcarbamoyladenosine biosynthesis protein TsaB, partial [Rubricella sp.]
MILSIDTSAAHCAAGLVSGGRLLAGLREEMGRGQAERLMPMIDEVFAASGMAKDDLTAIAVCTGPG